jgi:hypothetical protein
MNLAFVVKAFDTVMTLRDVARTIKGRPGPPARLDAAHDELVPTPSERLETRLTNVVVAALKEAFDRDRARLDIERAHIEEQRRHAQEALRLEVRRQAMDREIGRLRMLAATALVGWLASVAIVAARLGEATPTSRGVAAAGWLLLLGALAAAFSAQRRLGAGGPENPQPIEAGAAGLASLWLLTLGLGMSAAALLV